MIVADLLDPDAPAYVVDGREYLRVTTVLRETGVIDTAWFSAHAAQRGTYVHQAIELYHAADLAVETLDPILRPYVDAYWRFLDETQFKPHTIERRVFDPVLGYTGRLDLIGPSPVTGKDAVIDVKTGGLPSWVGLQLAAYERLVRDDGRLERFCLQLRDDGTYRLQACTDRDDERTFLAALQVAWWKRRHRACTLNA